MAKILTFGGRGIHHTPHPCPIASKVAMCGWIINFEKLVPSPKLKMAPPPVSSCS